MKPVKLLILFNTIILLLVLFSIEVASFKLRLLVIALLLFCITCILVLKHRNKWIENFQLLLFALILFCCLLETLKFFPNLLPIQIRNYLEESDTQKIRDKAVEYLDQSPFAKFRPNTTIVSQGFRGSEKQFVYEWKTDKLGFKNSDEILKNGNIEIVALGDSMTEGMGVTVEDTWPSILTEHGHITYNLGVQGYAPMQLEGSLFLYGQNLLPKYIVIGYCSDTYGREMFFVDETSVIKQRKIFGGIGSIASNDEKEIRRQAKHIITAIFLLLKNYYYELKPNLISNLRYFDIRNPRNKLFRMYSAEFINVYKWEASKIDTSPDYQRALNAFLNIKKMSDNIGAKVIFIYLPQRGYMYYKKATGKELPEDNFEAVEAQQLKKFCEKNGIVFLNVSKRIIDYVSNLKEDLSVYPYLEIDGHFSRYGNQLVAEEIIAYLDTPAIVK